MDSEAALPLVKGDIRSTSVPRLRKSSRRAKYGGAPPTDAFIPDGSAGLFKVELGKPMTNLSPAQKYAVAHSSVGKLIGKRVNRNNQRTGERNPWNYFGPGRRWEEKSVRGTDLDPQTGVGIWKDEKDAEDTLRLELNAGPEAPVVEPSFQRVTSSLSQDSRAAELDRNGDEAVTFPSGRGRPSKRRNRHRNWTDGWELVDTPEALADDAELDDSWDIVSACSAPD